MTESTARHVATQSSRDRGAPTRALRPDIEGMRFIAIGTVLAFHAKIPWVSGGFVGVDVFFVLSGFLITGLLIREVVGTGRIDLARFWARRMRRLLPASALTLAFSAAVAWFVLPVTQRSAFGGDIASAALYVVNWRLADRSVDYLAEDVGASPVQHFWSLAVEEQFYLVWPLLFVLVAIVARRRPVAGAFVALGAVTVVSFAYSVQQSVDSGQTAFFVSTTRVWELGVGALLALSAERVGRLPSPVRALAGWVGLAAVAAAAVAYDGTTTWPGVPALLPVLGTAAMVASGIAPARGAPTALLSLRPFVWVGGLSYSLYLWHWPILVAGTAYADGDLRVRYAALLVLLSFVPAWLSNRLVENPIRFGPRFRPTGKAIRLGVALTAVGVVVGSALPVSARITGSLQEASDAQAVGARALVTQPDKDWATVDRVDAIRPLPEDAIHDLPRVYHDGEHCLGALTTSSAPPVLCERGDTTADRTVVIVGDSKMNQWQDPLEDLAKKQGWRIIQITRNACAFTAAMTDYQGKPWTSCHDWGADALQEILTIHPDLVITSQRRRGALPPGSTKSSERTNEAMADGLAEYWSRLTSAGIPVGVLLDNPTPGKDAAYECVAQHPKKLTDCSFDRERGISGSAAPSQLAAAEKVPGVTVMDLTETICPVGDRCPVVIGDVLVYRQGSHITNTYALSAEPELSAALYEASRGTIGSPG